MNTLYPLFLKTDHLKFLIIGGGYVAAEKLKFLLKSSPNSKVTIIGSKIKEPLLEEVKGKNVNLIERCFHESDLGGHDIILAATNNRCTNLKIRQLAKLVDVVHATDHTNESIIETEVALIKIIAPLEQRTEILQIAEHYKAKVVDYSNEAVVLRLHGTTEKLDYCTSLLQQFEISELIRSGKIVMARKTNMT